MKRQEQRRPQEVMLVPRPPVAARGRYSGHVAPTCVCGGGGPPALVVSVEVPTLDWTTVGTEVPTLV